MKNERHNARTFKCLREMVIVSMPSEFCVWCQNLIGNDENVKCTVGKNPFRWLFNCDKYIPKQRSK